MPYNDACIIYNDAPIVSDKTEGDSENGRHSLGTVSLSTSLTCVRFVGWLKAYVNAAVAGRPTDPFWTVKIARTEERRNRRSVALGVKFRWIIVKKKT